MSDEKKVEVSAPSDISMDSKILHRVQAIHEKQPTNPHDAPPPPVTGEAAASDHSLNEWVLNHLPLTEEQKKELIAYLVIEQKKLVDSVASKASQIGARVRVKSQRIKESAKEHVGIKELTKLH